MSADSRESVAQALAANGQHDAERLLPALAAAEAIIKRETPSRACGTAISHFHEALTTSGASALDGGDPQRIEDTLVSTHADSPLAERTFRHAWLALVDHLTRSGDKPPFGGTGAAETWAFCARSKPWPFVDPGNIVGRVTELFGAGPGVVVLRGPGRSSMLAAIRRAILAKHGVDALVPPVMPAARDELAGVLRPLLERAPLNDELKKALPQVRFSEDLIGAFGRVGDQAPVALLLDDAHLQSRAILLGLPLFLEPSPKRAALLILGAPDQPQDDGPLGDVLFDASARNVLTQIALPGLDPEFTRHLLQAYDRPASDADGLLKTCTGPFQPAEKLRIARAVLADPAPEKLDLESLLPKNNRAREVLAVAALEGEAFHANVVGRLFGRTEDDVEDLLFDDEFELDGEAVGTCEKAVPAEGRVWANLPDGLHPVFSFGDARLSAALRAGLPPEVRAQRAGALRDVLLELYGAEHVWQVADTLFRLDVLAGRTRHIEGYVLGLADANRVQLGFQRLVPVLNTKEPYRLALARLFGAATEAGQLGAGQGNIQMADRAFQAAAAAAQRLGRIGPAGESMARLAEMRLALALPGPTTAALDVAEQLLAKANSTRSVARLGMLRGEVKLLEGDLDGAFTHFETARSGLLAQNDTGNAALAGLRSARIVFERGDGDDAQARLLQAMAEADASGDARARAAARLSRAFISAEMGLLDVAFPLLQEAAKLFESIRMPVHIVETMAACLQRRHGGAVEAEKRLRTMAEAFKTAGAAIPWADAWHEVGRALSDQKLYTDALSVIGETLEVRRRARDRFSLVRIHEDLGTAAEGQGDVVRAATELARARAIAVKCGLAGRQGRLDASLERLRSSLDGRPEAELDTIIASATAEHEALEGLWAAPLPVAESQAPETVH